MRATKTCVARHPGIAVLLPCLLLLIAFVASLTLVSCIGQKPNASLLANDIARLGFIPGKPVTLPPDFKAECRQGILGVVGYNFADGTYALDQNGMLITLTLDSPRAQDPGQQTAGMSKEQAADYKESDANLQKALEGTSPLIGPAIPREQQSKLSLLTWKGKDIFSLTESDLLSTYGPPSKPSSGPIEVPVLIDDNVPDFSRSMKLLEYVFQVSDSGYSKVDFYVIERGKGKGLVDMVIMSRFIQTKWDSISEYKLYPWPGLYPAPGKS